MNHLETQAVLHVKKDTEGNPSAANVPTAI